MVDLEDEEQGAEKRAKLNEEPTYTQPGFSLQLGEEKNIPASPRRNESTHEQVPLIKQMFAQIVVRN